MLGIQEGTVEDLLPETVVQPLKSPSPLNDHVTNLQLNDEHPYRGVFFTTLHNEGVASVTLKRVSPGY